MGRVKKAEVEAAISHYAPMLGVGDWKGTVHMKSGDGSTLARVYWDARCRQYEMDFFATAVHHCDPTGAVLPHVVIHELLHIVFAPTLEALEPADDDLTSWVKEYIVEPTIDPIARTLAVHLPRP